MARMQVLLLPASEDEHPFALILDQVSSEQAHRLHTDGGEAMEMMREQLGARAILAFDFEVEVV